VGTIHHEAWIDANPATVFDAITRKHGLDAWWGRVLNAEPEVGSVVEFDHGHEEPLRMRITDIAQDERLAWRCLSEFTDPGNPGSEWLGHQLVFELEELDLAAPASAWLARRLGVGERATILRFRHSGWAGGSRWFAFCNHAWGVTLDQLKQHCETDASPRAKP
jgi:uncharacterized protein YndB with AHSA1/START domain